jgi:hypothetical protein
MVLVASVLRDKYKNVVLVGFVGNQFLSCSPFKETRL